MLEAGRKRGVEDLMVVDTDLVSKKARKEESEKFASESEVLKAGLSQQLRRTNEDHCVELPRAGERCGSTWLSEPSEGGGPRYLVLVRNQNGRAQDGWL